METKPAKKRLLITNERRTTATDIAQPLVLGRKPTVAPPEENEASVPPPGLGERPEFRSMLRDALQGKPE